MQGLSGLTDGRMLERVPSGSVAVIVLLLLASLALVWRATRSSTLDVYPAFPPLASWSSLPYGLLDCWSSQGPSASLASAHEHLATPVLRTGPNRIHLSTASARLTRDLGSCDKALSYAAFDIEGCSTLFSVRSRADHAARAAVLAPLFTKSEIKRHEEVIFKLAQQTTHLVRSALSRSDTQPVNLLALFRTFAFEVASVVYMGRAYGGVDRAMEGPAALEEVGLIHDAFNAGVPLNLLMPAWAGTLRAAKSGLFAALASIGLSRSTEAQQVQDARLGAAFERYETYLDTVISASDDDAIAPYVAALEESSLYSRMDSAQRHKRLHAECADLLFAATESLSSTLAVGLVKVFAAESAESLGAFQRSLSQHTAPASLADVESNVMLQALVREALRFTSPVPRALDRIVGTRGLRLDDGNVLAPGTVVGLGQHTVHMDAQAHAEPDHFDPSRWLKSSGTELRSDLPFLAFGLPGAPSRACIARALAEAELAVMLEAFNRNFTLEAASDIEKTRRDLFNLSFTNGRVEAVVKLRR